MSWGEDDAEAYAIAKEQWRQGVVTPPLAWNIEQPEDFDAAVGEVDEARLRAAVLVDHDARSLAGRVAELVDIGFDRIYLHHVGREQTRFLKAAAAEILPALRERT